MSFELRLAFSLFGLRLGVFIVMFVWTIDKFINPEHTAKIFDKFYDIPGLTNWMSYTIGGIQALILLAFAVGFQKHWSYGLVFIMHFISTVSSYQRYLDPWTAPQTYFSMRPSQC